MPSQMKLMMGGRWRLLSIILTVPCACALKGRHRRESDGSILLHSLWDEHVSSSSRESVALSASGTLLRSERQPHTTEREKQGLIADRLISERGLKIDQSHAFDGEKALGSRLVELNEHCPGVLGENWVLLDSAMDTEKGHHWVLQGPGVDGAMVLAHVSSAAAELEQGKGHQPLQVTPRRLCKGHSSGLLESSVKGWQPTMLDDSHVVTSTDIDVVETHKLLNETLKYHTTHHCDGEPAARVLHVELLSGATENVADGIEIDVPLRLKFETNSTMHRFTVAWKVCSSGTDCETHGDLKSRPEILLPQLNGVTLSQCELYTVSTYNGGSSSNSAVEAEDVFDDIHLQSLAEEIGHKKVRALLKKTGLEILDWSKIGLNRTGGPDHTYLIKALGRFVTPTCLDGKPMPIDFDPRLEFPECINSASVQDQGPCASCWAFAAMTSLTQRACMRVSKSDMVKNGKRKYFSVQSVVSCNTYESGCHGSFLENAFKEARKGLIFSDDYPYWVGHAKQFPWSGVGKKCDWGNHPKPFIATLMYQLIANGAYRASVQQIQKELYCKGPIGIGLLIKSNFYKFFEKYPKSAYTKELSVDVTATDVGGHAATLIGWGLNSVQGEGVTGAWRPVEFWLLENSWTNAWGDEGFFRMERGQDVCGIESMSAVAGEVSATTGSWMYDKDWSRCMYPGETKQKTIMCKANDGLTPADTYDCPNARANDASPSTAFWPDYQGFPNAQHPEFQEKTAVADCNDSPDTCDMFSACNGAGDARMVAGRCQCTCYHGYTESDCSACADGFLEYPACREACTDADCPHGHSVDGGVKWENEFGHWLNSCECSMCDEGYKGELCDMCRNESKTFPHCNEELRPQVHIKKEEPTSPLRPTTTPIPPPCHVNRGPIELFPPTGEHWLTLDCDVRLPDCEPDHEKCMTEMFAEFCEWRNSTEFPLGQCLGKNSSTYGARIDNNTRAGENWTNANETAKEAGGIIGSRDAGY